MDTRTNKQIIDTLIASKYIMLSYGRDVEAIQ
jgi:hypothetical protein